MQAAQSLLEKHEQSIQQAAEQLANTQQAIALANAELNQAQLTQHQPQNNEPPSQQLLM